MKGCLPITIMVCDRQDLGSYSFATSSYVIAPQRLGGLLPPGLAPAVVLLKGLWGAKTRFSSHGGDALRLAFPTSLSKFLPTGNQIS